MLTHNGMRPQDVVVLLKIIALGDKPWQNKDLAKELFISPSEISHSLARSGSQFVGLYNAEKKTVNRQSLMQFIQYGLRYVFPANPGSMVNGMPTAHSFSTMAKHFSSELKYVWPDATAYDRGLAIQPLYPTVTSAAKLDGQLYRMLAMIDVIRIGRVREIKVALKELETHILHGSSY